MDSCGPKKISHFRLNTFCNAYEALYTISGMEADKLKKGISTNV